MVAENELNYLYSLTRFGIKPGLAVIEKLLEALGNPERTFKSIHVTGTNGKGSTCAMIESVLRSAGYKTALYTSPHLYAFNERIQINRVSISDDYLILLVREIREVCEREKIQPTFFEFTTALAFLYFSRSHIDIAVIEVGMGGRYDATNGIVPLVSVITNIGLDHTEYFGPTTAHIAREKAGIIKEGVPVVTAETDPAILAIFDAEATEKHTRVVHAQDVVKTRIISSGLDGQEITLSFRPPSRNPPANPAGRRGSRVKPGMTFTVRLPLLGLHQITNMVTAIAALSGERGTISQQDIISGIANVKWEGRLQIVSRDPLVIVDGAHNPDGARALATFLATIHTYDVLVFATKKGKDISDMQHHVISLFSHVIITEGSFMPEDAEIVAEKMRTVHKNIVVEKDVRKALLYAKNIVPPHGTIVVTGSLYMIPDVLQYFQSI